MKFPALDEKTWNRLPVVFREIIEWDEKMPQLDGDVIQFADIPAYLEKLKDWKYNRNNLSEGARRFIAKQRGGTVA